MFRVINLDGKKLMVTMKEYLKNHDVIYKTPAYQGYEALPAGNGDIGCMIWNSTSEAIIAVNKCDAVDYGGDGNFRAWNWEYEEKNTAVVSCGRIKLSDGQPAFDKLYLNEFEARLNLACGKVCVKSETPFSSWRYDTAVIEDYNCILVDIDASSGEPIEREVSVERWGSRNFFHYYEQYVGNPALKLEGTRTCQKDGYIYIEQVLRETKFVFCARLVGAVHSICKKSNHEIAFRIQKSEAVSCKLIATVVCGKSEEDLLKDAVCRIERCAESIEQALESHAQCWEAFWEKSFVKIEDNYIENLYYLYLYQMNCSSKGRVPALFSASLWNWNRDMRNWGHVYHWNQQQQYWGVYAANHPELAENYLRFRSSMLENAQKDAWRLYGSNGALFSDICNLKGYQAFEPDTVRNFTVGPQIALDMYRHYEYTQNREYLAETAYPFMKKCVEFYLDILKEVDGTFCLNGAYIYESYWNVKETLTDHIAIKQLFAKAIEAAGILEPAAEYIEKWRNVIDQLYPLPVNTKLNIFSCGTKWDDKNIDFGEGDYPLSPFTGSVLCPVYPAGYVGLKDKGTRLYELAHNTVRYFLDNRVYTGGNDWCGHTPVPQAAARMGMSRDIKRLLNIYADNFQCFPNGFMHYANIKDLYNKTDATYKAMILSGNETATDWEQVHEKLHGARIHYNLHQFLQNYNEAGANIMAAVNEMLLQSYDNIIRVFPAVEKNEEAVFSLLAQGNFMVSSEQRYGDVIYISIQSRSGGILRVYKPWNCAMDVLKNSKLIGEEQYAVCPAGDGEGFIIELDTAKGDIVILTPREFPLSAYYTNQVSQADSAERKNGIKVKGSSCLGKERDF